MIKPQPQRSSWAVFRLVILLSALVTVAKCEPCQETGSEVNCDAYKSYRGVGTNFPGVLGGDLGSELTQVSAPQLSLDTACPNANLFCFPSTLPGFLPKKEGSELTVDGLSLVKSDKEPMQSDGGSANITRMSDFGIFRLLGGRSISCSLNYHEGRNPLLCYRPGTSGKTSLSSCSRSLDDSSKNLKTKQVDDSIRLKFSGSSLPNIEVSPPLLEWEESFLYFPSLAFVMVMNTHKHSSLHVYEPYSTNSQFYPCNSSEILLAPGEAASVCFVFLPTSLGLSSAQLVLQTNFGGFLVRAKGFAVESPYGIQPVTLDGSSSGRWSKNISLFNPFNEALHVEEVISWTSVSMGNASNLMKTVCSINNAEDSSDVSLLNAKQWLEITNGGVGFPLVAMRPHGNWVVGPQKSEMIMELDFSWDSEAKIFGALCVQLLRSSPQNNIDTVIIPLEAELTKKPSHDDHQNIISLSLDTVMPCSYSGTVFLALIVHNYSPHVLGIVKIGREGDNSKQFQIKYMKGLVIFPHTATQVALVSYLGFDSPSQSPEIDMSCKIVVSTNGSRNSQVEIPCKDIVSVCTREKLVYSSRHGQISEEGESVNIRNLKASVAAEADEAILMNWKSQATASDMSVLDEREVVFPVIEVGHFCSEWITVKNPSPQPVLMQLILNSAEIIDECRTPERHMRASSSNTFLHNISLAPTRYGFSIAENAVTEVLVHPFDRASLGPVWFHPGSQCRWQSSALIRNNLSGVEWVSLGGFGGSLLMVLVEKSEPIQSLDFKMNLPPALNSSFPGSNEMDGKPLGCSQLLSKEVYAKNIGDLPLKVKRIEISGTQCQLDGFIVNSCEGFSLAPGESKKLVVSYQTDFSVATIQRDLELALTTGILVIPMKATLPMYMLSICKKSFLARLRKSFLTMVLVAFVLFIVSTQLRKSLVSFAVDDSQDYIPKSGKSCTGNVYHTRKPLVLHNSGKSVMLSRIIGLVRPYKEEGALLLEHSYGDSKAATTPLVHEKDTTLPDTQTKSVPPSNSLAIGSSDTQETPRIGGDLRVKVGNEKGRRRRKNKKSSGVSGLFDVSSSHSGNSTPSSPLSPVSTSTPKRLWPQSPDSDQSVRVTSPFVHVSKCENSIQSEPIPHQKLLEATEASLTFSKKPDASKKLAISPVMLPSATRSSTGPPASYVTSPFVSASSSPPCANARAPGSKLHASKAMKSEETRSDERFTYDIWGDHLFGLPLTGSSKNVLPMPTQAGIQNNSDSFFVRGPQILMNNSPQKVVSCPDHEG
nr:transmembrane protein 131 homolog isoform X2 [Ipomoea batatas]